MATTPDPIASQIAAAIAAASAGSDARSVTPGLGVSKAENQTYKVYMGPHDYSKTTMYSGVNTGSMSGLQELAKNGEGNVSDYDSAMSSIYDMTKYKAFEQYLLQHGVIQPGQYTVSDVVSQWQNAVDQAAKFYTLGHKQITPEQVVDMNAGINGNTGKSSTTTATSVNEVDPATARAALDSAFNQLLGRDPTNSEREAFYEKALSASQNRASVTTTTTDTGGALGPNNTSTSSTTSGGYNSADLQNAATDQAKGEKDFGPHAAATNAFNWLQQAIHGG